MKIFTSDFLAATILIGTLVSASVGTPVVADDFASPADFGVTDYAYKVSETDFNIKRSLAKAPVNEWAHQSDVSRVDTQQVIRENQDVIYSSAVVDVSKGATLTVPAGDRVAGRRQDGHFQHGSHTEQRWILYDQLQQSGRTEQRQHTGTFRGVVTCLRTRIGRGDKVLLEQRRVKVRH